MRWVVAKAQCRRGAIIDTRNEARFWKEKVKKNGGREGFPRLAAVCWAGGQPKTPGRNSSPSVVKSAMTASYHPARCGTSLRIFSCLPIPALRAHNLTKPQSKTYPSSLFH